MMSGVCALLLILTSVGSLTMVGGELTELLPVLVPAPGFYLTPTSSGEPLITLEFFLDLNCADSKDAWGAAQELTRHYSSDNVAVRIYMYPLPYHRNAMLCSQGLMLLRQKMPAKAQDYISMVFDHLGKFSTKATANQTETQVLELLADYTEQHTGLPHAQFLADIHDYEYNRAMRNEWKLGASRGVAETPTVFVNGIQVNFSEITRQGLQTMLDRLLEGVVRVPASNSARSSSFSPDIKNDNCASSSATPVFKFW